jgi:inner membrane protein
VQYGLVGLALSVFYLLLLALGEHLPFALAYLIATIALVSLLGTYVAGALHSHRQGVGVAGCFALVYGLLYGLIQSEDYALMIGALAVFCLLAVLMLLTRRVDWYTAATRLTIPRPAPSAHAIDLSRLEAFDAFA